MKSFLFSACAVLCLMTLPAAAAVYTVPGDFPSLEAAERVAGAGDTVVLLGAGRHPTTDSSSPRPFRVVGTGGGSSSVIAPPQPPNACADGTVVGRVTDANGAGVANVEVWFQDESTGVYTMAPTAPTGVYTACLPAGSYGLEFYKQGYPPSNVYNGQEWGCGDTVTVKPGETVPNINGVMATGGSIAGTVTSDGVTPLANVQVVAFGLDVPSFANTVTDGTGAYLIAGLLPGNHRVRFYGTGPSNGHGIEFYNDHASEKDADPVAVTDGSTTAGIDAVMPLGGTITGTVDDGSIGISGVDVGAYLPDGTYYRGDLSSGAGGYQITGLPTGSYRVFFDGQRPGYIGQWHPGSVAVTAPGDTGGINATLPPGGSISGTVMSGGAGLPNIGVNVFDSQGNNPAFADTDAAGSYTVPGLPSGDYRVLFWAEHEGYPNEWYDDQGTLAGAQKVTVAAPADRPNVDAQLTPFTPATLSGRVNYTGSSCGKVLVRILPPDVIDETWWVDSHNVGPSGFWHSDPLAPGPWRLLAHTERVPLQSRWYGGTPSPGFSKIARATAGKNTPGINLKVPDRRGPFPVPGIMAGEHDHVTFMGPGEKQPLLLSMDCGDAKGLPMDWWLLAYTPLPPPKDIYHFEPGRGWVEGLAVSKQAPCADLDAYKVLNLPFFPFDDDVDIFFGIDGVMNGALDLPSLFYDGVRANMFR